LTKKWQNKASYISTGTRLASDWTKDWELDTIRSGAMDNIIINLPRLAYESRGNDSKLRDSLDNCLEMIGTSLDIERHEIQDRVYYSLLPILSQKIRGEPYLRLRNSTSLIGFIGLNEATKIQTDHQLGYDKEAFRFAFKLVKYMANQVENLSRELGFRVNLTQTSNLEVSQRLAELDAKKFGWGLVFTQGTKENPYYTDLVSVPLETEISLKERLEIEGTFHKFSKGGHISVIELLETEQKVLSLLETTERVCKYDVGAFTFSRAYSFCFTCRQSFGGIMLKCPLCKAVDSLTQYSRLVPSYLPLSDWPKPKKMAINKRFRYVI
jgi:ribonucleoside-triphosphate reductase